MPDTQNVLRLRVLLCFLREEPDACSVTGIARILGEEKYTVSRVITSLERDGLIDHQNVRKPVLTTIGEREAKRYAERLQISINYLLYEGIDIEHARYDAFYWALYLSDPAMEAVRASEERYRVKYELRNLKTFSGALLCKKLKDGSYPLPFLIYRDHVKNGNNISMGNEGFEHPCILSVEHGEGTLQLHAVDTCGNSKLTGKLMHGRIKSMQYFDSGAFISVEQNGAVLSFPADVLNFVNIGSGVWQVLHGSVCLKMQCSVGLVHMPESTAIFTIMI